MRVSAVIGGESAVGGARARGGFAALLRLSGVDAPSDVPGERIRLLDASTLPGTEWILAAAAQRLWRVFHEDYELCVLPPDASERDGGASYVYRSWSIACRPGALYLLEPDTLHANDRLFGPSNYYVIKIQRVLVASVALDLGLGERPHFRVASTSSARLLRSLAALCGTVVARHSDDLERETRLMQVIRMVLEECAEANAREEPSGPASTLERAREYLHAHASAAITLSKLAEVSGLSRYHLVRSFARTYGLPPHAYLNQVRVAEARRQLAAGVPPAAVEVGFFDQAHLTYHFKRAYGVTPAGYRRAIFS